MSIETVAVSSQNITLVYEGLDLEAIDSGQLKRFMGTDAKPMVMDTPGMIVAAYPANSTFVQIGDNRIRITFQRPSQKVGDAPLWRLAVKCDEQLFPDPRPQLIAYGFNYTVDVTLADDVAYEITTKLFGSLEKIERALEGDLEYLVPRVVFVRDGTRYNLVLDPEDKQHIKVHLNVHYESKGITLPSRDQLQASFCEGYEYLTSLLPRLIEGGA